MKLLVLILLVLCALAAQAGPVKDEGHKSELVRPPFYDCWDHCGQKGGYCAACGFKRACCRKDSKTDPEECQGARSLWTERRILCCVWIQTCMLSKGLEN